MSDSTEQNDAVEHSLDSVPGMKHEYLEALKSHWLTTVEQVLAASASPGGREGLKTLLAMGADGEIERFLEGLSLVVGPEAAKALRQPAQPGGALGARLTEEQRERFGLK